MVPISLAFTNYKRFPAFLLDLSRDCLVISGENGSGKTQLLWGCLIFFHAFNRLCGRDEAEIDSIRLTGKNLAMLLGCPSIASLNSFISFANRQIGKMADTSIQFQATFDNEETWSVFLQINGKVDFQYNKALYPVQKIRFANLWVFIFVIRWMKFEAVLMCSHQLFKTFAHYSLISNMIGAIR